jgi:predicted O-linked N-acetylglucosamine transferase (SPINDLY family)
MLRHILRRLLPSGRTTHDAADRLIAEGNRAEEAGRVEEACERYREAVRAAPGYAKAHLNLGIGLEGAGAAEAAIQSYEAALEIDPADPFAAYNLGKLLYARGSPTQAERLLGQALRSRPDFPEARVVLAGALQAQGKLEAAGSELEAALRQRPGDFGALYRYAGVLRQLRRPEQAQAVLERALAVDPGNADACYELAAVLMERNEMQQAEPHLRTALARNPDFAQARAALFHVLEARGDLAGAKAELEAVLRQKPDWPDALYNYGRILKKMMRLREAEAALNRAIAADPQHGQAYRLLGGVLLGQCRTEEAIEFYRRARVQLPGDLELESAELFALNNSENIADDALFARHAAFGTRIEAAHPPRFEPFSNARVAERRLRIGYVSGDFCYHVVTLFMLPVVERHDRSAFEVYCYSTGGRVDDYSRELSARADVWRDVSALPAPARADAINRDGIDILVDLGGHSGIPQLEVFAQRPAPVQATWLGYLNTTGMTRVHYRISDRHADPPGLTDRWHTETLVRLPHSQWCYRPFASITAAETPPVLRNGHVTFGSFNQAFKISREVRRLWTEILQQLPASRLVILGVPEGRGRHQLVSGFGDAGIEPGRIALLPYVSLQDYFGWYNAVDIALDTMPYSGGTTTCDALWMGVPVVTAPGTRPSSRSSASILSTAGLQEWIASSPENYVRLAVASGRDGAALAGLRKSLRQRLRESPLMDEKRFVSDLESVFRQMWRTWCERGPS